MTTGLLDLPLDVVEEIFSFTPLEDTAHLRRVAPFRSLILRYSIKHICIGAHWTSSLTDISGNAIRCLLVFSLLEQFSEVESHLIHANSISVDTTENFLLLKEVFPSLVANAKNITLLQNGPLRAITTDPRLLEESFPTRCTHLEMSGPLAHIPSGLQSLKVDGMTAATLCPDFVAAVRPLIRRMSLTMADAEIDLDLRDTELQELTLRFPQLSVAGSIQLPMTIKALSLNGGVELVGDLRRLPLLEHLSLESGAVKTLIDQKMALPDTLKTLCLNYSDVDCGRHWTEWVDSQPCSFTHIMNGDLHLPASLESFSAVGFYAADTYTMKLHSKWIPPTLKQLSLTADLSSIKGWTFPSTLTELSLKGNVLDNLNGVEFPSSLKTLDLSGNPIEHVLVHNFPASSLEHINLCDTKIEYLDLTNLPASLLEIETNQYLQQCHMDIASLDKLSISVCSLLPKNFHLTSHIKRLSIKLADSQYIPSELSFAGVEELELVGFTLDSRTSHLIPPSVKRVTLTKCVLFGNPLASCEHLQEVSILGCDLQTHFEVARLAPTVEFLCISGNLTKVSLALIHLANLKVLNLYLCFDIPQFVVPESVEILDTAICEGFPFNFIVHPNNKLKFLGISDNTWVDTTMMHAADAILGASPHLPAISVGSLERYAHIPDYKSKFTLNWPFD